MKLKPYVYLGSVAAAVAVAIGTSLWTKQIQADEKRALKAPTYQVDPFWPKPLPRDPSTGKDWVTGEVAGTCIDSRDHVFIVTRGFQTGGLISPETLTGIASPPVLEFDPDGNLVHAWGDPSLNTVPQGTLGVGTNKVLPHGIHGCYIDYQDNLWIAGNGDGIVQKWTRDGRTKLLEIGVKGKCDWPNPPAPTAPFTCGNSGADATANQSQTLLNEPANLWVDPANGDVYIADGYGNHRVVVFDKTGKYLRQWGGVVTNNGNPEPGKFAAGDGGHPHCVIGGNDGLIYVCGRADDRVQVFTKQGVLQRIIQIVPGTGVTNSAYGAPGLGTAGSAWDVAFSKDAFQRFMFDADGGNEILWTLDRAGGNIIGGMGRTGHMAGEFTFLHSVSMDSKGNMYTGETIGGRRIQKFVLCNNDRGRGHGKGNNCNN